MQALRFAGLLPVVLLASPGVPPQATDAIRLNQVGFYPSAPKAAFIVGKAGERFYVLTADLRDTVFTGPVGPCRSTALSSDTTRAADFSALRTPDRKSTRLNSSHSQISYAVFCLKKKKQTYGLLGPK